MKNLMMLTMLFISTCFSIPAKAQISFNINIQPAWGPTGYDYVEYYYIPDMEAYYDVNRRVYVYMDGGRWVTTSYVPPRYRGIDLYRVHKVVINEREPWRYHDRYRTQYYSYRGRVDQTPIRESHEERYYQNPGHPQYQRWQQEHHDNGNHYGQYKHEDRGGGKGNDHGHGHDR